MKTLNVRTAEEHHETWSTVWQYHFNWLLELYQGIKYKTADDEAVISLCYEQMIFNRFYDC